MNLFAFLKRVRTSQWFSLIAEIDKQDEIFDLCKQASKYKESGLSRGEIRKQTATKTIKKLLAADDVAGWAEKLDTVVVADMTAEQKIAMLLELEKLRRVAYQKIKLLKG